WTMLRVWTYAPTALDHQAVANLIGYRTWGPWGSTMVWDTCFMLHFARYGGQAYPFITGLDNCYARQHENGFICRESDRDNREVYVIFPVNPPLFSWAEWEWCEISNDKDRLRRVLLPLVKHYEWWMTYQRRENGLYWVLGANEADDSPRNALMHYSVSATSYQALAALYLAKISQAVGRDDLQAFFDAQHQELSQLVNTHFWDAQHGIYNDLTQDHRFITEIEPGALCKHVHMFWPLMAGLVPPDRLAGVVRELQNPASFNRRNGISSLSADSTGYNKVNGQYWRGAVWPPTQCMVQEGLKTTGQRDFLEALASRYYQSCLEVFQKEKTIKENLCPDQPAGCGAGDFVGWGGIGPVANLIEYILGFDIDAPRNRIVWRITRTEKHGLENLELGSFKVDLICDRRESPADPCRLTITSGGGFTLIAIAGNRTLEKKITPGKHSLLLQ
ncbi:MAG: alpha,alpha-trehalase, partial [Candidatus Omnitrophica bacterium]|nr:alpha,alpha-trehalase [Candidatus Omnitrophota bacterium]